MSVELQLNAVNLALVAFSPAAQEPGRPDPGVLLDGRGGGRGRRRARDHRGRLPAHALGRTWTTWTRCADERVALAPRGVPPLRCGCCGWSACRRRCGVNLSPARPVEVRRRLSGAGSAGFRSSRRSSAVLGCRRGRRASVGGALFEWIPVGRSPWASPALDPLSTVMVLVVTGVGVADPHLLDRLHGGRRTATPASSPT